MRIKKWRRRHIQPLVLDNSTHLLGKPVSDEHMVHLAIKLRRAGWSDVTVVCPDVKEDKATTLKASGLFLKRNRTALESQRIRVMVVGQGRSRDEFLEGIAELAYRGAYYPSNMITVGIPHRISFPLQDPSQYWANRVDITREVADVCKGGRIHLLGATDPGELLQYRGGFPAVEVFHDTSAAYMYTKAKIMLTTVGWPLNVKEKLKGVVPITAYEGMIDKELFLHNMAMVRSYAYKQEA